MNTVVLLDPGVVLPARALDSASLAAFWLRLAQWTNDDRTILGRRAWEALGALYSDFDNPDLVPRPMKKDVYRAVGKLLGRAPHLHARVNCPVTLSHQYTGSQTNERYLMDDLVGSAAGGTSALGSDLKLWVSAPDLLSCEPPPPISVPVHFEPNLPTAVEQLHAMTMWFRGRNLLVIGGQVDSRVRDGLSVSLGIDGRSFRWIACEHSKKPNNLPAVINGAGDIDIVICITGKVGHSTSGSVERECEKRGIPYHFVEGAGGLKDLLVGLFRAAMTL